MWRTLDGVFRELQDFAAFIDIDLDLKDEKRFLMHARQRETALVHLARLVDKALSV